MNALFGNLTTDGLEEAEDRLGGYQPLKTDVYTGPIKAMYAGQADSGAQNVTVIVDLDGQEFRETVYITNKKGENFWLNKKADNKRMPLPGFTTINDICLVATGKPLAEQNTEEKQVMMYDNEARKELPKSVPMLVDCLNQEVTLAILEVLENKSQKGPNGYEPTAETRVLNTIDKVFDPESKLTVVEAQNESEAAFHDAWVEKNQGNQRDKRTIKDSGEAGTAGRPGASGGSDNTGGSAPTARKSLFGNKAA